MATDYKKIAEEHRVGYGSFKHHRSFFYEQLYKEKTHCIYELIQNAVDSKSSQLELRLKENELFVWNDGDQFSEKDVRNICSLGSSSKDLTQIGTFGIGFKSVYNYTDCPEIY
ncbi:sensor histidine kinase, partial [Candidatus Poribacteria bacterium]|nr:sensor histidine kinase [Candidatus Poribacteria bacterium]